MCEVGAPSGIFLVVPCGPSMLYQNMSKVGEVDHGFHYRFHATLTTTLTTMSQKVIPFMCEVGAPSGIFLVVPCGPSMLYQNMSKVGEVDHGFLQITPH